MFLLKIGSFLLILLLQSFSQSSSSAYSSPSFSSFGGSEYGASVQRQIAANVSMTRFIQSKWMTANGGLPTTTEERKMQVSKLRFIVIWN